ncbi:MAG: alpha/beta fold hydrolase, partial [Acidobacteriota bacterium]
MRSIDIVQAGILSLATVISATTARAAPGLIPAACRESLKSDAVRCGTILVPENPGAPNARTIALNVIVIGARRPRAGAPPLFGLDGGPGIAATDGADFYLGPGGAYREWRDVVLFDQRGTGASNPLRCEALEKRDPLQDMYSDRDVAACLAAIGKSADLSQYSSEVAADDIERVRLALGYEQIDIWALSYGTRLAQVYMKRHPASVHSVVLVGFVPLDYRAPLYHAAAAQRLIDLLFFKCQNDHECDARYPYLRREWQAVLKRLDKAPLTIAGKTIRRGPFAEAVRASLTTATAQRRLPSLIHAAVAGDFGPFLKSLPKDSSQFAEGAYLSIVCSESVARIRSADVVPATTGTFLGDYRVQQERAACAQWPSHEMSEESYIEPRPAAPILVIAGEMDNVAPPDWGFEFCSAI